MIMTKVEKYEHPDVKLVNLSLEGLLCTSFVTGKGDDSDLPGYDEEIFEW